VPISKKLILISVVTVVVIIAIGITIYLTVMAPKPSLAPVHLKFATFKTGSGWFVLGGIIAEKLKEYLPPGSTVDVLPYSGGAGNPLLLHQGKADIAFGFPAETLAAYNGLEPYNESMKELRVIAVGLDTYWWLIAVRKDLGFTSLDEIINKHYPLRLAVLPKGSSGERLTRIILKAYGVTYEDIEKWGGKVVHVSFSEAISLMKDGRVDAFAQVATPGHPGWTKLAITVPLNFLEINEEVLKKVSKEYGMEIGYVPKDTFKGLDKDLKTLKFSTLILATEKLPNEIAYLLAKVLCEKKDEIASAYKAFEVFDSSKAWKSPIPLHPGAEKYYKEKGYMP